jgi:hypothetical protein
MDGQQYIALPANRELVRSIASRVLLELEPSGVELQLGYLEPLIDSAAKAEVIVADLWDEAGRFGNVDLLGPVVVPLVLEALAKGRTELTREEVKRAIRNARSSQGARRVDEIGHAINKALKDVRHPGDEEVEPCKMST